MPASGIERERKFLVRDVPAGLRRRRHERIEQGYLCVGASDEVRIRRIDARAFLTVKVGRGMSRQEVEIPLTTSAVKKLWPLTSKRRVSKTRYLIPFRDATIQVDVYRGGLRGLVVAEVEFSSLRALRQFAPPEWIGREVTGQRAFSNSQLARSGRPRSRRNKKR